MIERVVLDVPFWVLHKQCDNNCTAHLVPDLPAFTDAVPMHIRLYFSVAIIKVHLEVAYNSTLFAVTVHLEVAYNMRRPVLWRKAWVGRSR